MSCAPSSYNGRTIDVRGTSVLLRIHPTDSVTPAQIRIIQSSLELVPAAHLRLVSQAAGFYIQLSRPGCPPANGGGHSPGDRWIRLSANSRSRSYNAHFNVTLLHELGHIVDAHYRAMETLRREQGELYRLLASTGHEGATGGAGERFADCYMIFLVTQVGGREYSHPADRAAYQGANRLRRFEALLKSPAFADWSGPLAHLRRS